jgi:hypothetical protein
VGAGGLCASTSGTTVLVLEEGDRVDEDLLKALHPLATVQPFPLPGQREVAVGCRHGRECEAEDRRARVCDIGGAGG